MSGVIVTEGEALPALLKLSQMAASIKFLSEKIVIMPYCSHWTAASFCCVECSATAQCEFLRQGSCAPHRTKPGIFPRLG